MLRFEVVWISGSNGTLAVSYETSFMGPRNVVRGTSRKEEYARVRTRKAPGLQVVAQRHEIMKMATKSDRAQGHVYGWGARKV